MDNYKERERATQDALLNELFGSADLPQLLIKRTEKVNELRGRQFMFTVDQAQLTKKLDEWKLIERHEILNATTEDGKKLYSNAEARDNELLARLGVDTEASALNAKVEALSDQKAALSVDIAIAADEAKLFRTLIELRIAEMGSIPPMYMISPKAEVTA